MEYFKLYACCIPVKGYVQTALCDIHRNKYHLFSNELFGFINEAKVFSVNDLKEKYDECYDEIISPLFSLLVSQDIGFFTDTPELFPDMNDIWEQPNVITNVVIDIDIPYDISNLVEQLDTLGCEALQIRFLSCVSVSDVKNMIQAFGYSRLRSIEAWSHHGKIRLSQQGAGKVKTGQKVNIKFDDYPYMEYGFVQVNLTSISLVPYGDVSNGNIYIMEVEMPDSLITRYGILIPYRPEMSGTAEIITEDLTVFDRLVNPIKSVLKR